MKYRYRPIIQKLREYKTCLEGIDSYEWKQRHYARTTGYIFGYIQAWNLNNFEHRFTGNDIDLIYWYLDKMYDKYIANK